ncbi:MAG: hypothetical protein KF819_17320 [Labilithrix sp.]|nr:hypothetical protein [Labilithrix sp.]
MVKLRAPLLATAVAIAIFGAIACNAIIGVEDVKLRRERDAGEEEELPPDEDAAAPDSGPKPQENALEVALGERHTCARKPDLTVKCWGDDSRGQNGTGGAAGDGGVVTTPQPVAITDATRIASGKNHTCVVRTGGRVSCWGDNQDGQLGNGQTNARSPTPVDVLNLSDATAIACGANFSCALRATGGVSCWGGGLGGQLGNGTKDSRPTPTPVSSLSNAVSVSAGEAHACAVKADGSAVCWGDGVNGQLGTGQRVESTTPVDVLLDDVFSVAAGTRSTCALKKTGSVHCWGANEIGQLGSGSASAVANPAPTVVTGLTAIALWAGANHACAVKSSGTVVCWGQGFQGQLGDGQIRPDPATPQPSPVNVSGVGNAIGVGTGGNHSCAPTATGAILCWGENTRGELGTGTQTTQFTPDSVGGYP